MYQAYYVYIAKISEILHMVVLKAREAFTALSQRRRTIYVKQQEQRI